MMVGQYACKFILAALDTPVFYFLTRKALRTSSSLLRNKRHSTFPHKTWQRSRLDHSEFIRKCYGYFHSLCVDAKLNFLGTRSYASTMV